MYNFFLAKGDKLIDLKPKRENYERAYVRKANQLIDCLKDKTFNDFKSENELEFKRLLFLTVKKMSFDNKMSSLSNEMRFQLYSSVCDMIGLLTPRELMQMFPIRKDYDGEKYQSKDYFYVMNMIEEHGIDNPINETFEFLWDYTNPTTTNFLVNCMTAMEALHVENGGKHFFEEMGIESYHIENGEMVSDWTGESVGKIIPRKLNNYMNID